MAPMLPYRRKAAVVEAVQYTPGMTLPPEGTMQEGYPALVVPALGPVRLLPGQWIIREPDGSIGLMTDRDFRMQYEPAGGVADLLAVEVEHLTEDVAAHLDRVLGVWYDQQDAPVPAPEPGTTESPTSSGTGTLAGELTVTTGTPAPTKPTAKPQPQN